MINGIEALVIVVFLGIGIAEVAKFRNKAVKQKWLKWLRVFFGLILTLASLGTAMFLFGPATGSFFTFFAVFFAVVWILCRNEVKFPAKLLLIGIYIMVLAVSTEMTTFDIVDSTAWSIRVGKTLGTLSVEHPAHTFAVSVVRNIQAAISQGAQNIQDGARQAQETPGEPGAVGKKFQVITPTTAPTETMVPVYGNCLARVDTDGRPAKLRHVPNGDQIGTINNGVAVAVENLDSSREWANTQFGWISISLLKADVEGCFHTLPIR